MGLFDDIGDQISDAFSDVASTGAQNAVANLESIASAQVSALIAPPKAQAVHPSPPPSATALKPASTFITGITQGAFVKKYGIYIAAGLVAFLALGGWKKLKKLG